MGRAGRLLSGHDNSRCVPTKQPGTAKQNMRSIRDSSNPCHAVDRADHIDGLWW